VVRTRPEFSDCHGLTSAMAVLRQQRFPERKSWNILAMLRSAMEPFKAAEAGSLGTIFVSGTAGFWRRF
jgi:hypothetical protein